ncbi:mechanosensitive ion channel family protein [Labilibaculum euxinus]|uniref:Mechanosensitive ion channel n=1 Tax=Labilibaculum euxinus TaxID=2686357 RepID=A0A7M4D9Q8_9BACT|nr:mechanosensitive ion channel family protein [Labilibaculum euxinus]MUP39387.1 mechanosensitive ion channel [Labilibaculum euxinus]MVB08592.1 mechanosensitive ion channel [Labilibaculum euxinus]
MIETFEAFLKNLGVGYKLLFILGTIISGFLISKLIQFFMSRMLKKASDLLKVDPTNYSFLKNAVSFLIFTIVVIVVFYSIPELKNVGISLMASAGILAAILGFASQQAFSNIISGIFIVIFKPFHVGDFIKIGELHLGTVEDITLRHTVIKNPENRRIIIPNSVISSETILNSSITDAKVCSFIEIGISYSSNIDKAIEIIQNQALNHPNFYDNRTEEEKEENIDQVVVRVINLGDSSVTLRAYVWAEDSGKAFVAKCDLLKSIKEQFDRDGIEIPFPHQTVYLRQEKPLTITQI